jgi:lipopolysaccharide/colanic/teichoic acid biosynthesis glycosyltransferase
VPPIQPSGAIQQESTEVTCSPDAVAGHRPALDPLLLSVYWNSAWRVLAKRLLDVAVSSALLLLLAPLFLLIALAIKLADGGPVFYPWRVVGQGGEPFVGFKFRSMVVDADRIRERLLAHNEMTGPVFKMTEDPRITSIGRLLRRFSLDEFPQLYSVLVGRMSLVGPRPPLLSEYTLFHDWQKQKLLVKPGITCLWQVSGRNKISSFSDWLQLDFEYIRTWSLSLDFMILLKTIPALLRGTGK